MVSTKGQYALISTKGRYALRVMIDIAEQNSDKFISLEEIALRQGISKKYLEMIVKLLVQRNLIKGIRGKGGGYQLTRQPQEYTVYEILELTEGTLACVTCLKSNAPPCERSAFCQTLPMWKKFDALTREFFSGITLQNLLDKNFNV